jgi:hypothetical protein
MAHICTVASGPTLAVYRGMVVVEHARRAERKCGGGGRGAVGEFSKASRLRLFRLLASCQCDPLWFITLTYPASYPSARNSHADFGRWFAVFSRAIEKGGSRTCVLWRLELQRRGAPHYHVLLWMEPPTPNWQAVLEGARGWRRLLPLFGRSRARQSLSPTGRTESWEALLATASCTWSQTIGSSATHGLRQGVDVSAVHSRRQCISYVSKYLAKVPLTGSSDTAATVAPELGRSWGVRGARILLGAGALRTLRFATLDDATGVMPGIWEELRSEYGGCAERLGRLSYSVFLNDAEEFTRLCRAAGAVELTGE